MDFRETVSGESVKEVTIGYTEISPKYSHSNKREQLL